VAPDFKQPLSLRRVAEVLAALLLLLWRLYESIRLHRLLDWLLLISLYWLFSIVARDRRIAAAGTVVFVVGLMILYLSGQLPLAFASRP
jgi:hypothetical protein